MTALYFLPSRHRHKEPKAAPSQPLSHKGYYEHIFPKSTALTPPNFSPNSAFRKLLPILLDYNLNRQQARHQADFSNVVIYDKPETPTPQMKYPQFQKPPL